MNNKYIIKLSDKERQHLQKLISSGIAPARTLARARVLLKSDHSSGAKPWTYERISEAFDVSHPTISNIRRRFAEGGLEAALYRKKPDREYQHRLDGEAEAQLIALACSKPPEGQKRWSLRLLQKRFIRLGYVETISHETIRTTLKKTNSSLG
jgi:hypothetical protein